MFKIFMRKAKDSKYLFFLGIAVFLAFGTSLKNDYALDDHYVTTESNELVSKGFLGILEIFTSPYVDSPEYRFSYRPIVKLTFIIEHQFFGFNPFVSHLINLLLYLFLVFLMFKTLKSFVKDRPDWLLFLIILLFALHPLHNEAVVSLKNREEILVAIFGFSALYFFIRYYGQQKNLLFIAGVILYTLGYMAKLSMIPYAFFIPLSLFFFKKVSIKSTISLFIILGTVGLFMPLLFQQIIGESIRNYSDIENPLYSAGWALRFINAPYIFLYYLKLHFIPYPLISYYGMFHVQIQNFSDVLPYLGIIILLALLIISIMVHKKNRLISWGILSFLLFIFPYLNFPFPAPGIIAERFAFMSVFGFSVVLIELWYQIIYQQLYKKKIAYIIPFIFILVFIIINNNRNPEWKNLKTLLKNDVEKAPKSVKLLTAYAELMHSEYNNQLTEKEKIKYIKEAAHYYIKAIEVYPQHSGAYENLGVLSIIAGQPLNGIKNLKKAIDLGRHTANTYYNLGVAYEIAKKPKDALEAYKTCLTIDPGHVGAKRRIAELK